ncbi:MAG: hypothetical protein M3N54_06395 [Acidobacteriota bacterium]|nr:hypothetical protein [Acidobacteriota bacterium]
MARLLFRTLVTFTIIGMFYARMSRGRLPLALFPAFYYWFMVSAAVFLGFGITAAVKAWRDPRNRRAYYADMIIALAWLPYWWVNLH